MKFKLFMSAFSFLLISNHILHAVGGNGMSEVTEEEAASKGVVRIYSPEDKTNSTAVLLELGKGHIGIGAKHSFASIDKTKIFAQIGKETRRVIRVFSNKTNDLALFVFDQPFLGCAQIPRIPEEAPSSSFQTATLYGFGMTDMHGVVLT